MKLTPPKMITFWISVALAALGLIGAIVKIPFVTDYAFWFVLVGYVLLVLSLLLKGL